MALYKRPISDILKQLEERKECLAILAKDSFKKEAIKKGDEIGRVWRWRKLRFVPIFAEKDETIEECRVRNFTFRHYYLELSGVIGNIDKYEELQKQGVTEVFEEI